jgi:DNA-binding PadR family transcriptional regulator
MTAPAFLPQTIGTTENALRALLDHHLSDTGLDYHGWVLLSGTAASGGAIERARLEAMAMDALKIDRTEVADNLRRLSDAGLVDAESATVRVTRTGTEEHNRLRDSMSDATGFILRDLPDDDVSATMRTLTKIAERANLLLNGEA